jgi:hypothetical protein
MLASLSRDASFFLPRRRPDAPQDEDRDRRPALIEDKVVEADALASALARLPRPGSSPTGCSMCCTAGM